MILSTCVASVESVFVDSVHAVAGSGFVSMATRLSGLVVVGRHRSMLEMTKGTFIVNEWRTYNEIGVQQLQVFVFKTKQD